MKHKWEESSRVPDRTVYVCERCELRMISRHEWEIGGVNHWTEYWRGTERIRTERDRRPKCEPVEVVA